MFIFIDHVPENGFATFTLRNFGFSDAAEVFVLLAGFSAVLAYGRTFEGQGSAPAPAASPTGSATFISGTWACSWSAPSA